MLLKPYVQRQASRPFVHNNISTAAENLWQLRKTQLRSTQMITVTLMGLNVVLLLGNKQQDSINSTVGQFSNTSLDRDAM